MNPTDRSFLLRALTLAARARGRTRPNPMVGAIVVRDGVVLGEGYHHRAGMAHAEVGALAAAGAAARGATLYVTLEPCNHHGRTPPCTDAILEAGIARVVAAMADPNPDVQGGGAERLRAAGLEVEVGGLEAEARALNAVFLTNVEERRPFVHLKLASTLDGRIAAADGSSRWITGAEARAEVHRLRASVDAVAIGIGTLLADDPELTARAVGARKQPVRVVFDRALRTPPECRLLETRSRGRVLLVTSAAADPARRAALEAAGAELITITSDGRHVPIRSALEALHHAGLSEMLVEGGATLAASLVAAGCVDRFHVMIGPKLLGAGTPALGDIGVLTMSAAHELEILGLRRLGPDVVIEAAPKPRGGA